MSKSVNTLAVGAFVVGAFLILFVILFSLSGSLFERNTHRALAVFDGSLKGLTVGAPVAFKGVPIGEVEDFKVYLDPETLDVVTPVVLRVKLDAIEQAGDQNASAPDIQALIDKGLRAQLQLQSLLTGLLYVQLDFYPGSKPRYTAEYLQKYDPPSDLTVIPTIPQGLEKLTRGMEEVDFAALADNAQQTLASVRHFVDNPDFQALPESLVKTLQAIEQLSSRLDAEIGAVSPNVNRLLADAAGTMDTLNKDMPALGEDAREALQNLSVTLEVARETLEQLDYTVSDDSALIYDLRKSAEEIGAAGRALRSLAESLETHPESLIKGKSAQ